MKVSATNATKVAENQNGMRLKTNTVLVPRLVVARALSFGN